MGPLILLALACADAPAPAPAPAVRGPATAAVWGEPLPPARLLRRVSLDLRGVAPSLEELDRVSADPAELDALIASFRADPRHADRVAALFAERWLTRVDGFNIDERDYHLDERRHGEFVRAVGEEPLRLLARIATTDRPWTDTVQADWTMADDILLEVWPLDSLEEGPGWRAARYTDGRPASGVLSTNGLWWRYTSTPNNYNRARAAALARLLLCTDYLSRPVRFTSEVVLSGPDLDEAIRSDPSCVSCHSTLDPLASALFGYWWFDIYDPNELSRYHPEREPLGAYYLDEEPAWFGHPLTGAVDLGAHVAADPRFLSCAVETAAEGLWRRPIRPEDGPELERLRAALEVGDLRWSALETAILDSAEYRIGGLLDGAPPAAEALTTRRMMSASQLDTAVAALTGFTWRDREGIGLLQNDTVGIRVLAGGLDGVDVTRPASDPSVTTVLVHDRLARAGALFAAQAELVDGGPPVLFLDGAPGPGDAGFEQALVSLHRRILSVPPDEPRLGDLVALWTAVEAEADAVAAWTSIARVLLTDPAFREL
jgi:hypothetical protein